MKRVIFVGLHHKPDTPPLHSSTKSGKLIDRIIAELPPIEIIKTNLFNVEYMPNREEFDYLNTLWLIENNPMNDDIIMLLGQTVHLEFPFTNGRIIKIAHPASKRSHIEMDKYVLDSANKIKKYL